MSTTWHVLHEGHLPPTDGLYLFWSPPDRILFRYYVSGGPLPLDTRAYSRVTHPDGDSLTALPFPHRHEGCQAVIVTGVGTPEEDVDAECGPPEPAKPIRRRVRI